MAIVPMRLALWRVGCCDLWLGVKFCGVWSGVVASAVMWCVEWCGSLLLTAIVPLCLAADCAWRQNEARLGARCWTGKANLEKTQNLPYPFDCLNDIPVTA